MLSLIIFNFILVAAVPQRKVRGKTKNQKFRRMVKAVGEGVVSLTFDRDVTYTPSVYRATYFHVRQVCICGGPSCSKKWAGRKFRHLIGMPS
ncbi:hypothetical protein Hanom_Chr03g00181491 [Helianthus anomalus]